MTCHCGKPALYRVPPDAFCAKHHAEAQAAQALVIRQREAGENEYSEWQRQIERGLRYKGERFRTHRRHAREG